MNVWGYILIVVVCATAFILLLSVAVNWLIVWFAGRYSGKVLDNSVKNLEKMLPGKNCGKCGCETCAEYALAVFTYRMETDRCPEGAEDLSQRMDSYMKDFQESLVDDTPKNNNGWAPRNPNL
jgi:Na+-translocating ferredoxin:NAD+ oxidoreductase RNF subunit RnfB